MTDHEIDRHHGFDHDSFLGMGRSHWVQFGFQIASFMGTLAFAVWYLEASINSVASADFSARALLSERVAILEADRKTSSETIKGIIDQEQAQTLALSTLTVTIARLQQTIEDTVSHRHDK